MKTALLILLLIVAGCEMTPKQESKSAPPSITAVMQRSMKTLMAIPGVVGVGEGALQGKPCILVLVKSKNPETEKQIPSELEGYPVSVTVVGDVRAR